MKSHHQLPGGCHAEASDRSMTDNIAIARPAHAGCLLAVMLAGFGTLAIPMHGADVSSTWSVVTGNWSAATNWTPNTFYPNNGDGGFTFDVTVPDGTITLTEPITIEKLRWDGGTISGGGLTINDTFTWPYNGLIEPGSGPLVLRGGGTVTGDYTKNIRGRTVINQTNSTWVWAVQEGYGFSTGGGAVLDNRGTVDVQTNMSYSHHATFGDNSSIRNTGTLRKSAGAGELVIGVPLNNQGIIDVETGILALWDDSTNTGTVNLESGTQLWLRYGDHEWNAGAALTGNGTVLVSGSLAVNDGLLFSPSLLQLTGTIIYNGHAGLNNVRFEGGTWGGHGRVDINGAFDWPYGGYIQAGVGKISLYGGGTVTGGYAKNIQGRTIVNQTNSMWVWVISEGYGFNTSGGAVLDNRGTVSIQSDHGYSGDGTTMILNRTSAFFRKSAGPGTATIAVPFVNAGLVEAASGILAFNGGFTQNVASATLILSNATISAPSELVIDAGFVRGSGNVNVFLHIMDGATIAPGNPTTTGTLTVNDSLSIAGTLAVRIANDTDYDRLIVNDTFIPSGNLRLLTSGYVPGSTNEFVIADGLFFSGYFTNVANGARLPTVDGSGSFVVHYGSESSKDETQVVLTDYQACPNPTITCPPTRSVLATSSAGATVTFSVTATTPCDPDPAITNTPASGSIFPIGETKVVCTATDRFGRTGECTFTVVVREITSKKTTSGLELEWAISGATLEEAPSVGGPWTVVDGATSPMVIPPVGPGKFFRLTYPASP